MPEFGQHAIFILAAYGVTFVAVCALALVIVADDRKHARCKDQVAADPAA